MNNISDKKGFFGLSDLIDEFDTKKTSNSDNKSVQSEEHIEVEIQKENLPGTSEGTEKETSRSQQNFPVHSEKPNKSTQGDGTWWLVSLVLVSATAILLFIIESHDNDNKRQNYSYQHNSPVPQVEVKTNKGTTYSVKPLETITQKNTYQKPVNHNKLIHIDGEINYKKVMKVLYGNLTYKNGVYDQPAIWNNIRAPWKEITFGSGLVFVAFEGKYTEGGRRKYILLTQTLESEDATCHACAPIVGGAVFAQDNDKWILESENKYISVTGSYGWMVLPDGEWGQDALGPNGSVHLIKIGPDKYGLYYKTTDFYQGVLTMHIQLIVPYKNTIIEALSTGLEGVTENFFDCEDNQFAKNDQDIRLFYKTKEASDYYDFTIVKHVNEGLCSDGSVRSVKKSTKYSFIDGYYKKIRP